MALAGGLSAQFGMEDETTYGTIATPSRFLEFNSETLKRTIERLESTGLRPNRRVLRKSQWTPGREGVSGDVDFDVQTNGFGKLFKHCLGGSEAKQPSAGSFPKVYQQTFTVGQLDGKSFTAQIGMGDSGGTVRALTWAGCKAIKWELACDEKGFLKLKPTVDAQSESTATALAVAAYTETAVPLVYTGGSIKIGGVETPLSKFSLVGETKQKVDRYAMRGKESQKKREQLEDLLRIYNGNMTMELENLSLYEKFVKGEEAEIVALFEGPAIEGTYHAGVEVVMKAVRYDGETPKVPGPGLIEVTVPYYVLDGNDGTGGVKLVYTTTDNAI